MNSPGSTNTTLYGVRRSIFNVKRENDDLDSFLKNALRMNDAEVSSSEDEEDRTFPRGKSYLDEQRQSQKLPSLRNPSSMRLPSAATANARNNSMKKNLSRRGHRSADIPSRIRKDAANLAKQESPRQEKILSKMSPRPEESTIQQLIAPDPLDSTRKILKKDSEENKNPEPKPAAAAISQSSITSDTSTNLKVGSRRSRTSIASSGSSRKKIKPPLTYLDLPIIRKDVNKFIAKRKVNKFKADYGAMSESLIKLNLHRTSQWSDEKRGKLKSIFRAYLTNTPGSSYALNGLF